jgi:Flp pilus assembly protein CpaB
MVSHQRIHRNRPGALSASGVFALALAIVAGLIVATVVKMYVFDKKPPVAVTRPVTVLATNILDKSVIEPRAVKVVQVSEERYNQLADEAKKRGTQMLEGNQPINRVAKVPLMAEQPVYEDQLQKLGYRESIGDNLDKGKRAVVLEMPAGKAMVQVGDRVDVLCTLSYENGELGSGTKTATAVLAHDAKVIARFMGAPGGSTSKAVDISKGVEQFKGDQAAPRTTAPSGGSPSTVRYYTLETSPYRFALIELAKTVGGQFTLSVANHQEDALGKNGSKEGSNPEIRPVASTADTDPDVERVSTADLARVFGIEPPPPEHRLEIETYSGVLKGPSLIFTTDNAPATDKTPKMYNPIRPANYDTNEILRLRQRMRENAVNFPSGRISANTPDGTPRYTQVASGNVNAGFLPPAVANSATASPSSQGCDEPGGCLRNRKPHLH